jgi:hypothetical protein
MSKARDIADLDFNSPDIDGGNIDGATIGGTTPAAGSFTGLNVNYSTQATANLAHGLIVNGNDSGSNGDSGSIFIGGINNTVRGAFIAAEIQSSANNHDLIFGVSGPSASPTERLRIASTGAATFNGTVETGGTLYIPQWIEHSGDSNTYFGFPSGDQFKIVTGNTGRLHITGSESVWNEGGEDKDFRVESSGNENMLFVDGGNNSVGIGTTPSVDETLKVAGEIRSSGAEGAVRVDSGSGGYYLNLTQTYAHPYSNSYIQSRAGSSYHGRLIFEGNTSGGSMEEFLRMSTPEGVIFNEDGIDKDFRVESNNISNMFVVDGGDDIVKIGTTESGQTAGSGDARLIVGNGIEITQDLVQDSNNKDMLRLSNSGSWSSSGNSGHYSDIVWDNGATNTMGRIGLRFGGTRTGGQSEFTIRNMYQGGFGNSGDIASFGSNRFSIFDGGMTVNEDGIDQDFRVESVGKNHALFVNGGTGAVSVESSLAVMSSVNTQGKINVSGTLNNNIRTYAQHDEIYVYGQLIGSGGVNTKVVTLSFETNHLRALTLEMESSGHKYNNGGDFWHTRHVYTCMSEGSNTRLNSRMSNLEFQNGTNRMTTALNKVSGSNLWQAVITFSGEYQGNFHFRMMGFGAVHAPTSISYTQT